jgi:hypothetical protein
LVKAAVLLAAEGLHPSSKGARIKFSGGKRTVIDGPFTETKELVAGFWIIQVKSKAEAIEWASRVPFADDEVIEVRQVLEASDFPPEILPPEAAATAAASHCSAAPLYGCFRSSPIPNTKSPSASTTAPT